MGSRYDIPAAPIAYLQSDRVAPRPIVRWLRAAATTALRALPWPRHRATASGRFLQRPQTRQRRICELCVAFKRHCQPNHPTALELRIVACGSKAS